MSKLQTYANTIKYLKPIQLYSQATRKFKTKSKPVIADVPGHREVHLLIPELDLNEFYVSRFKPENIPTGKICLLNNDYDLDYSVLQKSKMSPLGWFNLQYFEYAIALAYMYRKTKDQRYVDSFEKAYSEYISADLPYASYVISLQIPNVLIALEIFGSAVSTGFADMANKEIYRQYRFLSSHLETHLLGNHYFENLKALIIASYYFRDDKACKKYIEKLKAEADEQILKDGMHFELSPMYHKIILEDMLRISCIGDFEISEWTQPVIQRMVDALATLEDGINRTPLFNDSGDNVAKTAKALLAAVESRCGIVPHKKKSLTDAGYYRMESDNAVLLIDGGIIGPDYMPGHGHSDCLSFELFVNGNPVIVNSGTYQYQGDKRRYFRSTCAHNTVMMDKHEQSQCWGEHRVAKRIKDVHAHIDGCIFEGEYRSCCNQQHRRSIQLEDNCITVKDVTQGANEVKSYIHIPALYSLSNDLSVMNSKGVLVCKIIPNECKTKIVSENQFTLYAPEFGKLEKCYCIEFSWVADEKPHGYKIIL